MRSGRRFLTAILVLACLQAESGAASAQCGAVASARPSHSRALGGSPLAIGDSVLYDAVGALAARGFDADGMICRTMAQGLGILRARGRALPHLVVLALGTNGSVTQGDIDGALHILGPRRLLAMVTPHHGDLGYIPDVIRAAARRHRGRLLLLDWDRISSGHPEWYAPDGTHLGGPSGINAYAGLIASLLPLAAEPCPS
jgi:hypothetical protein